MIVTGTIFPTIYWYLLVTYYGIVIIDDKLLIIPLSSPRCPVRNIDDWEEAKMITWPSDTVFSIIDTETGVDGVDIDIVFIIIVIIHDVLLPHSIEVLMMI